MREVNLSNIPEILGIFTGKSLSNWMKVIEKLTSWPMANKPRGANINPFYGINATLSGPASAQLLAPKMTYRPHFCFTANFFTSLLPFFELDLSTHAFGSGREG